jgi:hypothetical protein
MGLPLWKKFFEHLKKSWPSHDHHDGHA